VSADRYVVGTCRIGTWTHVSVLMDDIAVGKSLPVHEQQHARDSACWCAEFHPDGYIKVFVDVEIESGCEPLDARALDTIINRTSTLPSSSIEAR
jgi:hypothetical protein